MKSSNLIHFFPSTIDVTVSNMMQLLSRLSCFLSSHRYHNLQRLSPYFTLNILTLLRICRWCGRTWIRIFFFDFLTLGIPSGENGDQTFFPMSNHQWQRPLGGTVNIFQQLVLVRKTFLPSNEQTSIALMDLQKSATL